MKEKYLIDTFDSITKALLDCGESIPYLKTRLEIVKEYWEHSK